MESTLFTALSTNEEANLSGGGYFYNSGIINRDGIVVTQYANAEAKGYYPYASASNKSVIIVK
ncbi:MAG: hypothetical protein V7K53_07810 [Nostoc sp.]|uniref:hypothetical protein n=1 Tax=Nostoc sp. TaxID=1180 RepID=UPI002FFC9AB5